MMIKSSLQSPDVSPNVRRPVRNRAQRTITRHEERIQKTRKTSTQLELPVNGKSADTSTQGWGSWKLILGILLVGISGLFYLNHVFQTQAILGEVSRLEKTYERARRINADRKHQYEQLTGPTQVQQRALDRGFIHGGSAEDIIIIKP
jgi:hypothetical protein